MRHLVSTTEETGAVGSVTGRTAADDVASVQSTPRSAATGTTVGFGRPTSNNLNMNF